MTQPIPTFRAELERLINRYSQENNSGTPDFILANYISDSLVAFNNAVNRREQWYGRAQDPRFGTPARGFITELHGEPPGGIDTGLC